MPKSHSSEPGSGRAASSSGGDGERGAQYTAVADNVGQILRASLGQVFGMHPWHGVPLGDEAPETTNIYIEMLPTDTLKYELDKATGILRVDRPQRFSSVCPEPYGFMPQTFCGERVAEYCMQRTGRDDIAGDEDPLDVLLLTEKHVTHANIFCRAMPIGGLRMLDGEEADDKIIAILDGDSSYGYWRDISQCPSLMVERFKHYFLTYKQAPDSQRNVCEITHVYGAEEAREVVRRAHEDYVARYGELAALLKQVRETIA